MSEGPVNPDSDGTTSQRHRLGPLHGFVVHIERTLGAGILVVLPIGVTILILKFFFDLLDPVLQDADGEGMLAVYIPTTPIPSSGFLVMVKAKDVTPTDLSVEDAMKVIISGGLLAEREFQQLAVFNRDKSSSNQ